MAAAEKVSITFGFASASLEACASADPQVFGDWMVRELTPSMVASLRRSRPWDIPFLLVRRIFEPLAVVLDRISGRDCLFGESGMPRRGGYFPAELGLRWGG
ncbi:hypothetical protein DM791_03440 [Paenarthrobacter nitroguajacolicus]|nr:hypothetical protein [Paenarthrobacter nitroguajacolicus]